MDAQALRPRRRLDAEALGTPAGASRPGERTKRSPRRRWLVVDWLMSEQGAQLARGQVEAGCATSRSRLAGRERGLRDHAGPLEQDLGVQALDLDARPVREHAEHRERPRGSAGIGARVERGEVAERPAVGAAQRHAEIAARAEPDQGPSRRGRAAAPRRGTSRARPLPPSRRAYRRAGTRCWGSQPAGPPERDRLHAIGGACELGHERVGHAQRLGEVLDEVSHELEARFVGGGLDDQRKASSAFHFSSRPVAVIMLFSRPMPATRGAG